VAHGGSGWLSPSRSWAGWRRRRHDADDAERAERLAGSYTLRPVQLVDVRLDAATVAPTAVLPAGRTEHGLARVYWLRLQSRGPHLWYVVKPTPYAPAMVFDARTGARLDPLSDALLPSPRTRPSSAAASTGSSRVRVQPYYAATRRAGRAAPRRRRPARDAHRLADEGRTLRRLNAASGRFEWWYRTFHVNQYTDRLALWTTLLYACAAGVVAVASRLPALLVARGPGAGSAPARAVRPGGGRGVPRPNLHRKLGRRGRGRVGRAARRGRVPVAVPRPAARIRSAARRASARTGGGGFADGQSLATRHGPAPGRRLAARECRGPVQAIEWRRLGARTRGW
jgi:hypothetical protein